MLLTPSSAGNNSRSSDIVRPNFENVRPISNYDRTRWPNISPAHLELSSSRCCQSINDVRSNLSNVRPKWRFERTYVLWIKKNYFQHCLQPCTVPYWWVKYCLVFDCGICITQRREMWKDLVHSYMYAHYARWKLICRVSTKVVINIISESLTISPEIWPSWLL